MGLFQQHNMISWTNLQPLLFTLGPIVIPKVITFIKSIQHSAANTGNLLLLNRRQTVALNILFIFAFVSLIIALSPSLAPENVFKATGSRLQSPVNVIFTRLAAKRPLQERDEILRRKFTSLDSRLLYAALGPDVLIDCPFCSGNDGGSHILYLCYALPLVLIPHLLHLAVLGLASAVSTLGRRQASVWRKHVIFAGVVLGLADIWLLARHDISVNARALHASDVDFFYWKMRVMRMLCFAAVDTASGLGIYLTATNRWQLGTDANAQNKTKLVNHAIKNIHSKLAIDNVIRTAVSHNSSLLSRFAEYWNGEQKAMQEVYEENDVVNAMKSASDRLSVNGFRQDATGYADEIFRILKN